jgi:putative membrane protein
MTNVNDVPDGAGAVLERLGIPAAPQLGTGAEAAAYDCGGGQIVKVYRDAAWHDLARRRSLYRRLAQHRLPFALPFIHRIGRVGATHYTVERKMPGRLFSRVLPELQEPARQATLRRYLSAVEHLGRITLPRRPFGEVLGPAPVQASSWTSFLQAKIEDGLRAAAADLAADAGDLRPIERFLDRELTLVADLSEKHLVHGDYWPENVFVDQVRARDDGACDTEVGDRAAEWDVSGLIDFSDLTVVGDARMDVAGAVLFIEALPNLEPGDSTALIAAAVARHGRAIERIIYLYRMYYSVIFSHCKGFDDRTYWWCVRNIRAHQERGANLLQRRV